LSYDEVMAGAASRNFSPINPLVQVGFIIDHEYQRVLVVPLDRFVVRATFVAVHNFFHACKHGDRHIAGPYFVRYTGSVDDLCDLFDCQVRRLDRSFDAGLFTVFTCADPVDKPLELINTLQSIPDFLACSNSDVGDYTFYTVFQLCPTSLAIPQHKGCAFECEDEAVADPLCGVSSANVSTLRQIMAREWKEFSALMTQVCMLSSSRLQCPGCQCLFKPPPLVRDSKFKFLCDGNPSRLLNQNNGYYAFCVDHGTSSGEVKQMRSSFVTRASRR
jgi:hypothetical protein